MSHGDLTNARQAIADQIKAALPDLYTCETHGGRFAQGELVRYSKRAPAVLVAALRINSLADDQTRLADVSWAAFILTRDTPQATRDIAALDYTEALLRCVRNNRWNLDASKPAGLGAQNLYSGDLDKQGVALWAVTWRQGVSLSPRPISELADFTLYTATHEVGDGPVTESRVELHQEEQP